MEKWVRREDETEINDILGELKKVSKPTEKVDTQQLDDILNALRRDVQPEVEDKEQQTDEEPQKAPEQPKLTEKDEKNGRDKKAFQTAVYEKIASGDAEASPKKVLPKEEKDQPAETAKEDKRPQKQMLDGNTSIWYVEVEKSSDMPRVGKAAALDKVDPNKFAQDAELLSWFAGNEDESGPKKSRKELKREKAKARREEELQRKREQQEREAAEQAETQETEEIQEERLDEAEQEDSYVGLEIEEEIVLEEVEESPVKEQEPEEEPEAAKEPEAEYPPQEQAQTEEKADGEEPKAETQEETDENEEPAVEEPTEDKQLDENVEDAEPAQGEKQMERTKRWGRLFGTQQIEEPWDKQDDDAIWKEEIKDTDVPGGSAFDEAAEQRREKERLEEAPRTIDIPLEEIMKKRQAEDKTKDKAEKQRFLEQSQAFDIVEDGEGEFASVAKESIFTQDFSGVAPKSTVGQTTRSLYVNEMADDDRFQQFFSKTVIVNREDMERVDREEKERKERRRARRKRGPLLTGEFSKLASEAQQQEEFDVVSDEFEDYNVPQDAPEIEQSLGSLKKTLLIRTGVTVVLGLAMLWQMLSITETLPFPATMSFENHPMLFTALYMVLLVVAVVLNFTTIAAGFAGMVGEQTSDTPTALATLAALLQGVVVFIQVALKVPAEATLFGGIAVLLLAMNAFGKFIRAHSILSNFRLASSGLNHSAGYILDTEHDLSYVITRGLDEDDPTLLISRPTALVKGFMRQSFSPRKSDSVNRIMGWVLLVVAVFATAVAFVQTRDILASLSSFAAVLCFGAPLSSTLVSAIPSLLLQQSTARVGAVVPGWSAIEDLGNVNVVMAEASDIFPPSSIQMHGIKTFQKERIDLAILYAASVLVHCSDTMRDIFMGVIQGKSNILYKAENIMTEPGRGFSAWVDNKRVVIGTREMLQKHDIKPPSMEIEMKFLAEGRVPVYLGVSGKLFAMFIFSYSPDEEVQETLDGLIKSGVSLLIHSTDMNVTDELIEDVYELPRGVVKVLGKQELHELEPLTEYRDESEGVMTHEGTFASFIGGMRAAAGCAAAEMMAGRLQIAAVALACIFCLALAFSGGLTTLSILAVLAYQLAWTLMVAAIPLARRY